MDTPYSTGIELLLCSCEKELILVITDNAELVCAQIWAIQDRATELLAPSLERVFAVAGLSFDHLRRVGCVRGPGSFTGTRLVLATAAALRRSTPASLAALDYMQALATTAALGQRLLCARKIWVLTHARRNLVHAQPFFSLGPLRPPAPLAQVRLMGISEAADAVRATADTAEAPVVVCGSALTRSPALAGELASMENVYNGPPYRPSIDALRILGLHGEYYDKDVEPLYVRPCDAVENLPALALRMGHDPESSTTELSRLLSRPPLVVSE